GLRPFDSPSETPQLRSMPRHSSRARRIVTIAVLAALASCGPPNGPREEEKTGALGQAIAAAEHQSAGGYAGTTPPIAARARSALAGAPSVVMKFDRPKVTYEDPLYSALSRALDRYPAAAFDVVLAMPALVAGADAEEATARGERRIEDVVLLMTDIGLPA